MTKLFQPNTKYVIPCFWEFSYRYNSLYRHWELNKDVIQNHIEEIRRYPTQMLNDCDEVREKYLREKAAGIKHDNKTRTFYEDGWSEEIMMDYTENIEPDINFFPEFLKASTLSMALSAFENLLGELSEDIAKELGVEIELPEKGGYINGFITWFARGCGLEIELSKENKRRLHAIRNIRNRFIHRISRDIPKDIQNIISAMVKRTENDDLISNEFIDHSLLEISALATKVETAYIKFLEQKNENDFLNKLGIPEDLR